MSCQTELRVGMQSMLGVVPVQIRGLSMQLPQMLNSWFNTHSLHISIRNMFSFLGFLATGGMAWAVLAWFQKAKLQWGTELRSIHICISITNCPCRKRKKIWSCLQMFFTNMHAEIHAMYIMISTCQPTKRLQASMPLAGNKWLAKRGFY